MSNTPEEFEALLRDCQVQASYEDVSGKVHRASDDALVALLRALGVEIRDPDESAAILAVRRDERHRRGLEPVYIAWDAEVSHVALTIPSSKRGSGSYRLDIDSGPVEKTFRIGDLERAAPQADDSPGFEHRLLPLPKRLPPGYHNLQVELNGEPFEATIISAPRQAYQREEKGAKLAWGCFLPLYALRTQRDWGVGDFTALRELTTWVGQRGGSDVATLPLLAAYLDGPLEISPYRPVSRLFWNELYIDVEAIPELKTFAECRRMVDGADFRRQVQLLRDADLVDYATVMRLKREVLERLAGQFFAARPPRFGEFQKFLAGDPAVEDYARFRAATQRQGRLWPNWPERMRGGQLDETDYDTAAVNYHLYAQWIAAEQLGQVRDAAAQAGCGLYLDLPVGVDPRGYDAWRYAVQFMGGARVGAPPDVVFAKGQDWGLPPLHPERIRATGYDLLQRVMATNMRFAHRLRIDHVLGFHRLYCIPPEFGAADGAYIRYRADELYAVAILESHRHRCALVGENLGTVPPEVDEEIAAHGISGMWVAPYELEPGRRQLLSPPKPQQVAMLDTHDMPPFAAWWNGDDIDDRLKLGLVDEAGAKAERKYRSDAAHKLRQWLQPAGATAPADDAARNGAVPLRPLLRSMAASRAHLMTINLEDLWLETRPQNIPGNYENQPNWRRKAQYRLEQFRELPEVLETLGDVDAHRKTKEQQP
jgi:4-alpha-glucanotransferase